MPPTPDQDGARWAQVDALFDQALDRPPTEREAWLRDACGDDQELLQKVRRLLDLASGDDELLPPEGGREGSTFVPVDWSRRSRPARC